MTVATNDNVTKLYIATFNRAPDAGGLTYWVNQSGLTLEEIAQSFFDQKETQDKYNGMDNQTFIETVYQNVLAREGEEAGVNYWVGELNDGKITKDNAILAILGGATGSDATLLENRTEVGVYYAQSGKTSPDPFDVIKETNGDSETVGNVKNWIDGNIPQAPSTYFVLDDDDKDYNLTGSDQDDVFVIEEFKTANINGGKGSDTVDFQEFNNTGVNVSLSTGIAPNGMTLESIENIRGTSGTDSLTGNSDANILVSMGGNDSMDGGVGNDRLLFNTVEDLSGGVNQEVNGGQNTDTLEITGQTNITVDGTAGQETFRTVSDVEILQVGYDEEGSPDATTITLTNGGNLNMFDEVRGTESHDKKGNATNDKIQSAGALDVSGVKLTSIEELESTEEEQTITIGKDTLTSVKSVIGEEDADNDNAGTQLVLDANNGDVFDLTQPNFTNIDNISQQATASSTVIVNQKLINDLAATAGDDGFDPAGAAAAPVGNWTESTLKASGIGLDLSVLADGDTNFDTIEFGTAREVTVGNINDNDAATVNDLADLDTITGSDYGADLLRIKPDAVAEQDLTAVTITKVERLDLEEISNIALDNGNVVGLEQISGDDDQADGAVTTIDAGRETAIGGLNLKGIKLEDIAGLTNAISGVNGTVTIDTKTQLGSAFQDLDHVSNQTIILGEAGAYDFSQIDEASGATIASISADGVATINMFDQITGSSGNDIVKGAADSMSYTLGDGDDNFTGTDTANELVLGGAGNDTISLGDNADVTDTLGIAGVVGTQTANLILSSVQENGSDYIAALDAAGATVGGVQTAVGLSFHDGAYADGGTGDDAITSGDQDDILIGGTGNDTIKAGGGFDIVLAGAGDDVLSGGDGTDWLAAGAGNDVIEGNAGGDFIFGGEGRDVLRGDQLENNDPNGDIEYLARDVFLFEAGDSGVTESTVDVIKDFLSADRAAGMDVNGDGNIDAVDAGLSDVIAHNWFAANAALAGQNSVDRAAADGTGLPTAGTADNGAGVAYDTFAYDAGATTAASLQAAADAALDKAYSAQNLHTEVAANEYTSQAVQFEYGGKEYVVIDAYVTGDVATAELGAAANNYSDNDLIVEIADTSVSWSINADDVVVTRWDTGTL